MSPNTSTGWFGIPGKERSTNVHIYLGDGKCLCGYTPHKSYEYQWCANGIQEDYLECKKCKDKIKKLKESA